MEKIIVDNILKTLKDQEAHEQRYDEEADEDTKGNAFIAHLPLCTSTTYSLKKNVIYWLNRQSLQHHEKPNKWGMTKSFTLQCISFMEKIDFDLPQLYAWSAKSAMRRLNNIVSTYSLHLFIT